MSFRSFTMARLLKVLALILMLGGVSSPSVAEQVIIKLKSTPSSFTKDMAQLRLGNAVTVLDAHPTGSLVLIEIPTSNAAELSKQLISLQAENDLEYLVPNITLHAFDAPNDTSYPAQWALRKVQAEGAWAISKGAKDVTVAVIDTGVAGDHEDLKDHIAVNSGEVPNNNSDDDGNGLVDDVHGWDFKDNDNNPHDETSDKNPGHGTHCAGIVGAVGDNGKGISGIAQVVSLLPVRFLGADGSGDLYTAAKAIDYAVAMKVDVISASWGAAVGRAQVQPILDAIERAGKQQIIFVAAAANDGQSNDSREVYPANAGFANVISVAASDPQDTKPSWSNYGRATVDLAAPGLDILSTIPNNQYRNLSGTSMATPLVAGSVALAIAHSRTAGPTLTPVQIKALLQASGATVGIETACHCRIDMAAALTTLRDNALVVVPNAATLAVKDTLQFSGFGGSGPFTFTSSNPAVATMAADGVLTAASNGETTVTIADSQGHQAASRKIYVGKTAPPPGGPGTCPFKEPQLCDIFCRINPQLPWCKKANFNR